MKDRIFYILYLQSQGNEPEKDVPFNFYTDFDDAAAKLHRLTEIGVEAYMMRIRCTQEEIISV